MNRVNIIGRLVKNVESRKTINNEMVSSFKVAVNDGYGTKQHTNYIDCVAFRKLAENISKYCEKGSLVAIEGKLNTSIYEAQDGSKRKSVNVIVEKVTFLGNKKKDSTEQGSSEMTMTEEKDDPFKEFGEEIQLSDEDLPF